MIIALYVILAFVMLALIPLLQGSSFFRAYMLVIFGAAFMFLTIGVVTYSILFPRGVLESDQKLDSEGGLPASFDAVMNVLREDERQICRAIWKEGGTMLEKDVRWVTGFSKVKTYRVARRLASRGVITVSKDGRLNRLSLAPWLYGNTEDSNQ